MKHVGAALFACAAALAMAACVQAADRTGAGEASKNMPVPPAPVSPSAMATGRGEVKQVDRDAGTITVQHGALADLQVPATTTMFRVKDRALLDHVKQRDKITFGVSNASGLITMIEVERGK